MKKENFWWYNIKEKKFVEDSGCRRRFGGLVCFLSKAEIGWCVVEATTGSRIGEVCFTMDKCGAKPRIFNQNQRQNHFKIFF